MMRQKVALISGCTGQSGSFLAELLLEKGYEVHGIIRRSSLINTHRIDHIYPRLHLHYGDLTDSSNLIRIMRETRPDEVYNLGAQSHVGVSFEMPEYTAQVDAVGTLRMLEAIRLLGLEKYTRFYQASTSELYGLVQETPQTEKTPFYPRSPYGVAKLYGYWIVKNYREAYGLHASSGILFNHETVADYTPMIFKEGTSDEIDIKPISEIVRYHTNVGKTSIDLSLDRYQETEVSNDLYVWDKTGWTKVKFASGYPHKNDKNPRVLVSKNSAVFATGSHQCIMADGSEKEFSDITIGDRVSIIEYPNPVSNANHISDDEAKLIGFIVGDGSIGKDMRQLRLTGKDLNVLKVYEDIWTSLGGSVVYKQTTSGFTGKKDIWQLHLDDNKDWILNNLSDLYTEDRKKRVPKAILNSNSEIQKSFLLGYNHADGLKSNPCVYTFKNFKTNSATLASGLLYLLERVTDQEYNINVSYGLNHGKNRFYYSINILSDSNKGQNHRNSEDKFNTVKSMLDAGVPMRKIHRDTKISRSFIKKINRGYTPTNHHFLKLEDSIKKIIDIPDYDGWFFDLETESGTFHCGVGQGHVHNSSRRGETFVTRKIVRGLSQISSGNQDCLYLGNLNAKRDWGHAKDFVEAMWMMLQQDKPDDYVIATGEQYSVRDFVEEASPYFGMFIEWQGEGLNEVGVDKRTGKEIIRVDPRYFRPAEVDSLLGDASKAKKVLGWKPKHTFKQLVEDMCIHGQ